MQIKVTKEDILKAPLFPHYGKWKKEGGYILLGSIHVHLEKFSSVEVYKHPILTWVPSRELIPEYEEVYYRECLRTSKYFDTTIESVEGLPLVAVLSKFHKDFKKDLHYTYP
jgi:hypothetical protein